MRSRVQADRGDATPDPLTLPKCLAYARDPKIYIFAYLYLSSSTPAYAFAYFLPNILLGMGYSIKMVFLLVSSFLSRHVENESLIDGRVEQTAPPYASAAISTFLFARLGDKLNLRAPLIAVQALIVIIGLSMTGFAHSNAVRYAGVFLGMAGSQGNIPATLAYVRFFLLLFSH